MSCLHCGKGTPDYSNFCNWDCHVARAKANGAVEHLPNGLPVKCITADGLLIECEHGDHPDYKLPVDVEYVGPVDDAMREDYLNTCGEKAPDDAAVRGLHGQTHAVIYTDGSVVLTMYECCYAIWALRSGECLGGSLWGKPRHWKMSEESRGKIRERLSAHESQNAPVV